MTSTSPRLLAGLALLLALVGALPAARAEPDATRALLRRGLGDVDRGVRYACVVALGKSAAPAADLAPALRDPERCVRREAAWWLRQRGAAAGAVLGEALAHRDPAVRRAAAWALSGLDAAALPLLARALEDADEGVRLEALAAARRAGTEHGRPFLAPLAERLGARFEHGSAPERYEAALALVRAGPVADDEACALLARRLREARRTSSLRDEIVRALLDAGAAGEAALAGFEGRAAERLQASVEAMRWRLARARGPRPRRVPPDPAAAPPARPATYAAADAGALAPWLERARADDVGARIEAWLELGRLHADADTFRPALASAERDERVAAAMALADASGAAAAALGTLLEDANWRVRCAAARAWGARREDPTRLAPWLASDCVPLAHAAAEAIRDARAAAAVAAQVAGGHYGALHFAPRLFERFGAHGAPAAPRLAALLVHEDVNVRETAARCLAAIGKPAADAAPALVEALADERLCVVAHASLALGCIGREDVLRAALADPRARVRAYAAHALAWSLGARNGVDQVAHEARLPVLAAGRPMPPGPLPDVERLDTSEEDLTPEQLAALRRAIWSRDAGVAVRAAARLDYDRLDAVESERVVELLLPEGLQPGSPVDFDRLRSIVGSSELPACIGYVTRTARTDPHRTAVFANFHRIARAEHLPWLCHLERVEELDAIDGVGELWQPAGYTTAFMRERLALLEAGDPGPAPGDPARAILRDLLAHPAESRSPVDAWVLNDFRPRPADAPLLLRFARNLFDDPTSWSGEQEDGPPILWAAVRALGRVRDPASAAWLRARAAEGGVVGNAAAGALTRRGDVLARALLRERAAHEAHALDFWTSALDELADAAPRAAARLLAEMHETAAGTTQAEYVFHTLRAGDHAQIGTRWTPAAVLGIEPHLAQLDAEVVSDAQVDRLARAAVGVPGCATRRVARALFVGLENDVRRPLLQTEEEDGWDEDLARRTLAFLHAADPQRARALLGYLVSRGDEEDPWRDLALTCLYRLGDLEHVDLILERFARARDFDPWDIARIDGPRTRAWLARASLDETLRPDERAAALATLAHLQGWPERDFDLRAFDDDARAEVADHVRAGRMALVRAAHPRPPPATPLGDPDTPVWERLARRALAGDVAARADFWSALRAGRYRWVHYNFDAELHSLGWSWSTVPHWITDLDSNCCLVSDGLADGLFERALGLDTLYGTEVRGFGRPLSERVLEWFALEGGALVWSPILERWIPAAE